MDKLWIWFDPFSYYADFALVQAASVEDAEARLAEWLVNNGVSEDVAVEQLRHTHSPNDYSNRPQVIEFTDGLFVAKPEE